MLPSLEELKAAIEQGVPGAGTITVEGPSLVIEPKALVGVCGFLKGQGSTRLDCVSNLTAVDYPPDRIEVVYHLSSMAHKHGPLPLKVKLPRANPIVASVTPIWRGAEFQEREVYDLFGVRFEGHPDLRRILMWEGFEGYPLRKDYVVEDQDVLEKPSSRS